MPNYLIRDLLYSSVHGTVWKGFRVPGPTKWENTIYIAKRYCYEPQEFSDAMSAINYVKGENYARTTC